MSSIKECKYGCKTPIMWDTVKSVFVEPNANGIVHDKDRCQGIRTANEKKSSVATIVLTEGEKQEIGNLFVKFMESRQTK